MSESSELRHPPLFCEYASGPCDQRFDGIPPIHGLVLYPAHPPTIAATIEAAVELLRSRSSSQKWLTWRDIQEAGSTIFCTICKHTRFADLVVADVTTLNFNLLFEIGFAIGLKVPVIPIRDTTFIQDKQVFEDFGLFDTLTYLDFQNSQVLYQRLSSLVLPATQNEPTVSPGHESTLYVLKDPIDSEGTIRLMATVRKSNLTVSYYDAHETPRLSLHEVRKRVATSRGIVAHLLSEQRQGHLAHNARCALAAGIAMASGKRVLLLQEGKTVSPIDYRDVVVSYDTPTQVPKLVEPLIIDLYRRIQTASLRSTTSSDYLLARLDLGDTVAENEVQGLRSYFVRTGQFVQARQGHARLVVGRKGTGKTAIFYALQDSLPSGYSNMVLALKPETSQFKLFREVILSHLSPALREHTMTAFWNYLLLCEITQRVLDQDYSWAQKDERRRIRFENLEQIYRSHSSSQVTEFSERLTSLVDSLAERYGKTSDVMSASDVTTVLFKDDIPTLGLAVAEYLQEKQHVWLLVDSLDRAWPVRGAGAEDIMIIRSFIDASAKLEQQLAGRGVGFHPIVFMRSDLHVPLIASTSDQGKDTAITLDWNDTELFKEMVRLRVCSSDNFPSGQFDEIWRAICDINVGAEDSFQYMMDRTLRRPRDLLLFLQKSLEVAINRSHSRILEGDILKAEETYSQDMLYMIESELRAVYPDVRNALYPFLASPINLSREAALSALKGAGFSEGSIVAVLDLLVWFGFLGVQRSPSDRARYAYEERYELTKVMAPIENESGCFVIHPAFRSALECVEH
jgi:hypothetical protein